MRNEGEKTARIAKGSKNECYNARKYTDTVLYVESAAKKRKTHDLNTYKIKIEKKRKLCNATRKCIWFSAQLEECKRERESMGISKTAEKDIHSYKQIPIFNVFFSACFSEALMHNPLYCVRISPFINPFIYSTLTHSPYRSLSLLSLTLLLSFSSRESEKKRAEITFPLTHFPTSSLFAVSLVP